MSIKNSGGYDDGYSSCNCFWGTAPGSLIQSFIQDNPNLQGVRVLDLGCGEGKNSAAFARCGADVVAVDCSAKAIANGQQAFRDSKIEWRQTDVRTYLTERGVFDVVLLYGLLHCLASAAEVSSVIQATLEKTRVGGHHFVVSFNNGPHDLTAHPGFSPTLLPHLFYVEQYVGHKLLVESNSILHEIHPNNGIPHFHSLTRLLIRKER